MPRSIAARTMRKPGSLIKACPRRKRCDVASGFQKFAKLFGPLAFVVFVITESSLP